MEDALSWPRPLRFSRWRELVMPKEHGSWSLAFEPLAFGLIVAPSAAGGCLFAAAAAAFFARRPLRIAATDARSTRRADARRALAALAAIAVVGITGAVGLAGTSWLVWLWPTLLAGAAFAAFDLRNAGRGEAAEVAGAAAFALLPAAFAVLAGATPLAAIAVATVMVGRSVPTVLYVRAALRAAESGERRVVPALAAAALALAAALAFARAGFAPAAAVAFAGLFALRAAVLLVYPRPAVRARTIGMIEGALGAFFVLTAGFAWTL